MCSRERLLRCISCVLMLELMVIAIASESGPDSDSGQVFTAVDFCLTSGCLPT